VIASFGLFGVSAAAVEESAPSESSPLGDLVLFAETVGPKVAVSLDNGTDAAVSGLVIIAAYDAAGKFLSAETAEVSVDADVLLSVATDAVDGADTYKAFAWDMVYVPLADNTDAVLWGGSGTGQFDLAYSGKAAKVFVDADDEEGIRHAAENVVGDIRLVTGVKSELIGEEDRLVSESAVIAGALGNPFIDQLIDDNNIDLANVAGKWEVWTTVYLDDPVGVPGVKHAMVIVGSDKRGAVYGLYNISEAIGVSPWGFFADSAPTHRDNLFLEKEAKVTKEPSVKYRGIFINDERSMDRWMEQYAAAHNFTMPYWREQGKPAYRFTHEFYVEVFDMILRQYGNYLWPAMWSNSFWKDDPLNGQLANDYGIVIGTTHQEFMNTPDKEWVWSTNSLPFQWINPSYPAPENWRYVNRDKMIEVWTENMEATKEYEAVVNMGLRGLNDVAIFPQGTKEQNIALLNDVIKEQRKIIENVHGTTDVPQSVIIYKEVEAFYYGDDASDPNLGWKASIDDDITVILCDDNHGNVRGLPMDMNRDRSGGFGMYYHFDYNGAPRSYRWVDTTPLEKIREQMMMSYDYGVDRIWVTNVGDLKFNEAPIDYWFKLAYDVDTWGALDGPDRAHKEFAEKEFGEELADDIAEIIFDYTYMNNVRKPEIVLSNTFSLTYFGEAETMLAKYEAIADKALEIKKQIPLERMDAYYNLVLHPTLISCNAWKLMINLQKNQAYQALGLPVANDYAEIARACLLFDNFTMYNTYGAPGLFYPNYASDVAQIKAVLGEDIIAADENSYYCVGDGKYYGYYPRRNQTAPYSVVSDSSIYYLGLTSWAHRTSQFAFTTTGSAWSRIYSVTPTADPSMVVLPQSWLSATLPNAKTGTVALHKFTSYGDETRYIDVGNTSLTPFDYTAAASEPWIVLDKTAGTAEKLDRIYVRVDWTKVPAGGSASGSVVIAGAGAEVAVTVTAEVFDTAGLPDKTFVETDGYISILSKHYASSVPAEKDGVTYQWTELPDYGRVLSSMKVMPTALDAGFGGGRTPGVDAPYLEYNVYIKTPGDIDIITQWAPTNGMDPRQLTTLNYGVQLGDDEEPQIVNSLARNFLVTNGGSIMWSDGAESATRTITLRNNGARNISQHTVTEPGVYTLRIYMVNDGSTLQKILVGTNTLARSTVAVLNNQLDTMTNVRFNYPAYTTPTILTGQRDGTGASNAAYFGPPESYCTEKKSDAGAHWVGTWASAQYYGDPGSSDGGTRDAGNAALTLPGATLRQIIRTAIAGPQLRLTFSNEYGATPLTIQAASVAKANGANNTSDVDVSTNTAVTFNGGSAGVTIQPGAFATSDPLDFPVAALERIAVSTYFGDVPTRLSAHIAARANSYLQRDANAILDAALTGSTFTHWFTLCSADVLAPLQNKSIVALGDSITDGYGVTNELYTRWVDILMNDLQANPDTRHLSVVNMGIGTNALLSGTNPLAARSRFERDVLNQPGVGYVVFLIGVNDLPGGNQTPANMIAAFDELFKAAAAKGIKVYGGTISPRGSSVGQDANRQTVNTWIRQQYAEGNLYGLADFDELLRNPTSQNTLSAAYRNDSIHPNAAGYAAMGDYVYSLILEDIVSSTAN
jgi:lysophospholipase L1-like esterase